MSTRYTVRYVHKIAPSAKDVSDSVGLPDGCFADRKTLAKALRNAGVLGSGERVSTFRVEGDRVIVFPMSGIWHAIVLMVADTETYDLYVHAGDGFEAARTTGAWTYESAEHIGFGHGAADAVNTAWKWHAGPASKGWGSKRFAVEIRGGRDLSRPTRTAGGFFCVSEGE